MIFLRGKGIIIAKKDIEEADRYITIFMEDYGKVSTVIKGIRKSKKILYIFYIKSDFGWKW